VNVLVDSDLRARLTGFGRARIINDDALEDQTKPPTGLERGNWIGDAGDSIQWNAPEIMNPDKFGFTGNAFAKLPSKSTDIYALGMTILEVLAGRSPFGKSSDSNVLMKVMDGVRPERPDTGFSDGLWSLLQLGWSEEYEDRESKRPSIASILGQLQKDSSNWFSKIPFPSADPKRESFRSNRSRKVPTKATSLGDSELHDLLAGSQP